MRTAKTLIKQNGCLGFCAQKHSNCIVMAWLIFMALTHNIIIIIIIIIILIIIIIIIINNNNNNDNNNNKDRDFI